ncbi:Bro-N domain-containing protein [Limnobaculum eriocheiris]|uniref:BRO-N domain-containing protein n=1 Tax=Limnobaculum eriocheiris TaxID=2897391 RepID=UPI0030B83DE0
MCNDLLFNGTRLTITCHNQQIWLRGTEIASALGMETTNAITQLYHRNSDEFNDNMTLTLKLKVKGFGGGNSSKDVRVFSLRGAHLIAMFARTPVAKEFRKWVLDILDKEIGTVQQKIIQPSQEEIDLQNLHTIIKHFNTISDVWQNQLCPALRFMESPILGRLSARFTDSFIFINRLEKSVNKRLSR